MVMMRLLLSTQLLHQHLLGRTRLLRSWSSSNHSEMALLLLLLQSPPVPSSDSDVCGRRGGSSSSIIGVLSRMLEPIRSIVVHGIIFVRSDPHVLSTNSVDRSQISS